MKTDAEVRNATLLANDIIRGRGERGLWVSDKGTLTLSDGEVTVSALSAVRVESHLPVSITKSLIRESRHSGIHFLSGSAVSLSANIASANEVAGICIEEGAEPEIAGNLIENNKAEGVRIAKKGGGTIRHNVLRRNAVSVASKEHETKIIEANTDDATTFRYQ